MGLGNLDPGRRRLQSAELHELVCCVLIQRGQTSRIHGVAIPIQIDARKAAGLDEHEGDSGLALIDILEFRITCDFVLHLCQKPALAAEVQDFAHNLREGAAAMQRLLDARHGGPVGLVPRGGGARANRVCHDASLLPC